MRYGPLMRPQKLSVALLAALAVPLSACGSTAPTATQEDRAACETLDQYGPLLSQGLYDGRVSDVDAAARGLHEGLSDAGPDGPYSDDLSAYVQIVEADALLIGSQLATGQAPTGSGRDTVDHLLDLADACKALGVPVDGFDS